MQIINWPNNLGFDDAYMEETNMAKKFSVSNKNQEDGQAISNAAELAKARRILLTADWAVTPEEKQLARKIIDRLTHNAARAYNEGAKTLFGEYSCANIIPEGVL